MLFPLARKWFIYFPFSVLTALWQDPHSTLLCDSYLVTYSLQVDAYGTTTADLMPAKDAALL